MNYRPMVSIVIPVYNGANYLRIAIDSALAQTYDNLEVIVVNDGSNDNGETANIAKSYGDRIQYYEKENGGVATALNLAISLMHGEWFSWLSHDDVYKPNKINNEINLLNSEMQKDPHLKPEKCVVYCGSESINSAGDVILKRKYKAKTRRDIDEILINLSYMHVGGCTMLVHKKAFDEIGMFKPERTNVQDKDLIYNLYTNRYTFLFVNEYLVQSRRHKEQTGNKVKKTWQKEIDELNCDFINIILNNGLATDIKTKKLMLIYYQKNDSRPAVDLLKATLKNEIGLIPYFFRIEISLFFWKIYGIGRKAIRQIYRKTIAGQK